MDSIMLWAKDIFIVVIAFTFLEILIPASNLSKYIKFIFSLVLLVIILEPIIRYISA